MNKNQTEAVIYPLKEPANQQSDKYIQVRTCHKVQAGI